MHRVLGLGIVIVAGLTLSACVSTRTAHKAAPVTSPPLIANATTIPTASAVAWTPVQAAQTQAAQLAAAEEQYATCFAYAGLDRGLIEDTVATTTPVMQSCSSYGLSSVEVRQIQDLLMETA